MKTIDSFIGVNRYSEGNNLTFDQCQITRATT